MTSKNGISGFIQSLYHDPFRWSLVKSVGLFALGIRVAQECIGLELLAGGNVPNLPNMPSI